MGRFPIIPLYFIIFGCLFLFILSKTGVLFLFILSFLGIYTSLFYQKVVSLHADVLCFFSDLNKIIELCIYNER